ncbi:flagellar biosynthesis protein FlhF [Oceanispirochaeta crateris]|uniref:Flagellar biosynthesis protein FlhF n=1 Tax=Oceanispirochaeta crateris TaxID=2518645 RepID=A0A5C1QI98_9SPIO|nr:flagellar biosynthesis protein FlhF [Oceanispirochaeta crateris]QEN07875.1 flagellar biosynthesis protein FlhF [Oceanispirochaeta crateris]
MEQHFTESGYTHAEVISNIRVKYGDKAKILFYKSVRLGGFMGLFSKDGVEYTGYITDNPGIKRKEADEKNKKEILNLAQSQKGSTLDEVLKEVKELKEKMNIHPREEAPLHPSLSQMKSLLKDNDFSDTYIDDMITRLRREFSLEDLDQYSLLEEAVMTWVGESLREHQDPLVPSPRVFVLVGPTGVGKTTTIAKLAAINGVTSGDASLSVCMITIDNYRIGARTQIETYGDIMGIPVFTAESYEDLKEKIEINRDQDLIFVDTIGKSPRDFMKLAEMRSIVEACGDNAEIHLAISSTTKDKDIHEILDQFEPFHYKSVILTKLDETTQVGNLISILSQRKKALSYITDGQGVPQDISRNTRAKLLNYLTGFSCDTEQILSKLDKKYNRMWS